MSEDWPTTKDVRAAWQVQTRRGGAGRAEKIKEAEAKFDRWLAREKAKWQAEALREAASVAKAEYAKWDARWQESDQQGSLVGERYAAYRDTEFAVSNRLRSEADRIEREAGLTDE